ncbi:MAG: adenylate/guanylate cyclase domain-containing protein [Anaerolineae bacterium]
MQTQSSEPTLDVLLNREVLDDILESFSALLPQVTVTLLETDGSVVARFPSRKREDDLVGTLCRTRPLRLREMTVGQLQARGAGVERRGAETALSVLQMTLEGLLVEGKLRRMLAAETLERYREINLLYKIGESISASLDLKAIPGLVLQEAGQIIEADAGLVVLLDEEGEIVERADFGRPGCSAALETILTTGLKPGSSRPLQTEILGEAQLAGEGEEVLSTVVMAPMSLRERLLGAVLLGRERHRDVFTAGDRKLLAALAGQTAVAVENARLFASVTRQRDAIAKMNVYMDNIFASLASGVITLDGHGKITFLNQAAGRILGIDVERSVGNSYERELPYLKEDLVPLVEAIKRSGETRVGYEVQPRVPERGVVSLRLHLSPLQSTEAGMTGVTIVVDDLTEQKQLEAEVQQMRSTFERYVSPRVVEQLLSDPSRVQLGGTRQEVTILFADIRGFTSFSESVEAETLFEILNRHLTLASQAVLEQEGTLDKFMGDAVMAIFNAPLFQEDHALRAVRAAWQMKEAIAGLHTRLAPELQLSFGVGISTGQAVVGNVGSPMLQNYTAIGNTVNLASRLQSHAGPGQILIDEEVYTRVREHVCTRPLGRTYFKGHSEPTWVYELLAP